MMMATRMRIALVNKRPIRPYAGAGSESTNQANNPLICPALRQQQEQQRQPLGGPVADSAR